MRVKVEEVGQKQWVKVRPKIKVGNVGFLRAKGSEIFAFADMQIQNSVIHE